MGVRVAVSGLKLVPEFCLAIPDGFEGYKQISCIAQGSLYPVE